LAFQEFSAQSETILLTPPGSDAGNGFKIDTPAHQLAERGYHRDCESAFHTGLCVVNLRYYLPGGELSQRSDLSPEGLPAKLGLSIILFDSLFR